MSGSSSRPPREAPTLARWRVRLFAVLPFALTSLITMLLTLLVLLVFDPSSPAAPLPTATRTDTPSPQTAPPRLTPRHEEASPTLQPVPSLSPLEERTMRQEVEELRAELRSLWGAYYLARAALQLADAEAALRVNDLDEVDQVLMTVGVSLDLAYERSAEQEKGPIREFRMQVGQMREDLYIRPENMDLRLRRLRQSMLSLVDEDR